MQLISAGATISIDDMRSIKRLRITVVIFCVALCSVAVSGLYLCVRCQSAL